MSTLKVDGIRSNSASSDAITLASNGTCTANITNNLSNRNLVINGAMQVAQRGTSSTSSGYHTVDRWSNSYNADANITFTQHALTSSDSGPYEDGFRFSNHAQNGSTGAGATQSLNFQQPIEAQNVAQSGWNYTSNSSFITLSFWAKSSVGQTFNMSVMTIDGTVKNFPFDVTLSANTWTKVTKTIPGDSSLQINNDNGEGFRININVFTGTDRTANSVSNDTWQTWSSSTRFRDNTSTWFTTNGATFEYTGVQLEVGSVATDFEHRSFAQELALCQRYYYEHANGSVDGNSGEATITENACFYASNALFASVRAPVTMRTQPSLVITTGSNYYIHFSNGSSNGNFTGSNVAMTGGHTRNSLAFRTNSANGSAGHAGIWRTSNANAKIAFNAEL